MMIFTNCNRRLKRQYLNMHINDSRSLDPISFSLLCLSIHVLNPNGGMELWASLGFFECCACLCVTKHNPLPLCSAPLLGLALCWTLKWKSKFQYFVWVCLCAGSSNGNENCNNSNGSASVLDPEMEIQTAVICMGLPLC